MQRSPMVVGRDRERSTLTRLLSGAASGQGAVALVSGEAGIGKSALVGAVVTGSPVVFGRGAAGADTPVGPVVELALGLLNVGARADSPVLGVYRRAVEALLPGLTDARGPGRGELPHPVVLGDALLRLWSTLPVPDRPVLVVEDLHWVDEASWAVLRRIAHGAPAAGAALLLTSRPEGPRWSALERLVQAREALGVTVGPLTAPHVAQLVEARLEVPEAELPAGLLETVAAAGGRPLLVEAVLDDLVQSGGLVRVGSGWSLTSTGRRVPATLESATAHRLDALSRQHRRVVDAGAVLGRALDADLLAAAFGVALEEVAAAVRAAVRAGLLEIEPAGGVASFRHELLREAVLAGLLDSQRRAHAARLLGVLRAEQGLDGPGPDALGTGRRHEDRLMLAARLAAEAGRPAEAGRLQLELARRMLTRGLPLAANSAAAVAAAQPDLRDEALACQVQALALAGEVDRALSLAGGLDTTVAARVRPGVAEALVRATAERGDWPQAQELVEAMRADDEPPSTTALAALVALELGRSGQAETDARRALDADPGGATACQALEVLGRLSRQQDLDAAQAWFRRGVKVAEAAGLVLWRARALHEEATIAQLRSLDIGPLARAREAAVGAGAPGLVSTVDFHLAAVLGVRFEADEALVIARRLLADARSRGATGMQAWAWILIGQAHAVAGRRAQAELAAAEATSLGAGDAEVEGVALGTCRGLACLLVEDQTAGLAHWHAGVVALRSRPDVGPLPPWYLWPLLATVADLDGDGGQRARAETADAGPRLSPGVDALWHLAQAVAHGRAGDVAAAQVASATAAERFAAVPAFAGWRHLGHRWAAADAITAGWGDPAGWMTEASQWFAARDLHAVGASCRGLARRAGARQRRHRGGATEVPPRLDRLGVTGREVDVLRLVADGLTNSQIAQRLYLSPRTVKGYVEQLLAKTGAANRTQLAARLRGQGDPPQGGTR